MSEQNKVKSILSVTIITFVSRIMSLVGNQIYLSFFGPDDPFLNIYVYSLQIVTIIFACVGTLLTTIVVPTYSSKIAGKDKAEADRFLNNIISISSLAILVLMSLCFVAAPLFFRQAGDKYSPEMVAYGISIIRLMLPVMFFNGLNFIFQGILQSHGHFKQPAAITIPSSLITVFYMLIFGGKYGVTGLAVATLIGLSSQAVFLLPGVIKTGYRYKPSFEFKNPEIVRCARSAGSVLIAVSAYQINSLFGYRVAFELGQSAILSNVQNIIITSVLAFVFSITAVYYPELSILWSKKNKDDYKKALSQALNVIVFFLIPATFGFILVRYSFFNFIARWGKVDLNDVYIAGNILGIYALGIVAMGFKEVLDRGFYAQKNTKVSAVFGFVIMGVNIMCILLFVEKLGIYSIPLSYSISSAIGVSGLLIVMSKKIGGLSKDIIVTVGKSLVASVVMALVVMAENKVLFPHANDSIISRAIILFIPAISGGVVYFAMAYFLKMEQMNIVVNKIKKSKTKQ